MYEGNIYFELNLDAIQNIYLIRNFVCLKYLTYRLIPVLTPKYKQLIFSPAKVRKGYYLLVEH